jgi:hypothetical protein
MYIYTIVLLNLFRSSGCLHGGSFRILLSASSKKKKGTHLNFSLGFKSLYISLTYMLNLVLLVGNRIYTYIRWNFGNLCICCHFYVTRHYVCFLNNELMSNWCKKILAQEKHNEIVEGGKRSWGCLEGKSDIKFENIWN